VLRVAKLLRFPDASYRLLVQGVARARTSSWARRRSSAAASSSCRTPVMPIR
jgi:hypothetical protein